MHRNLCKIKMAFPQGVEHLFLTKMKLIVTLSVLFMVAFHINIMKLEPVLKKILGLLLKQNEMSKIQ